MNAQKKAPLSPGDIGFRVLGLDLFLRDPNRKVFDTLTVFASSTDQASSSTLFRCGRQLPWADACNAVCDASRNSGSE